MIIFKMQRKKLKKATGTEKEKKIAYYSIMFQYLRISVKPSISGGITKEDSEKIRIYEDFKKFCGGEDIIDKIHSIALAINRIDERPMYLARPEEVLPQRYASGELPAGDKLLRAVQQPKDVLERTFRDLNNNLNFIKLRSDLYKIFGLEGKEHKRNMFIYTMLYDLTKVFDGTKPSIKVCEEKIAKSEGIRKEWGLLLYGILGIAANLINQSNDWDSLVDNIDSSKREASQDFVRRVKGLYDTQDSFGRRKIKMMTERYTPSRAH